MPSKHRSSRKSKPQKKRGGPKTLGIAMVLPLTGAGTKRCQLTYCGPIGGTESAAGTGLSFWYRVNGPYDPDTTVFSGATPGLSNLASLYQNMRVHKCTVRADLTISSDVINLPVMLSIVPCSTGTTLPSNPMLWSVQPFARSAFAKEGYALGLYSARTVSLSATITPHVICNITREQYSDEADYASPTNSNPVRQIYAAVAVHALSTKPMILSGFVRVSYDIEFFNPQPIY